MKKKIYPFYFFLLPLKLDDIFWAGGHAYMGVSIFPPLRGMFWDRYVQNVGRRRVLRTPAEWAKRWNCFMSGLAAKKRESEDRSKRVARMDACVLYSGSPRPIKQLFIIGETLSLDHHQLRCVSLEWIRSLSWSCFLTTSFPSSSASAQAF